MGYQNLRPYFGAWIGARSYCFLYLPLEPALGLLLLEGLDIIGVGPRA